MSCGRAGGAFEVSPVTRGADEMVFAVRRNPSPALGVELNTLMLPGAQKADRYPAPSSKPRPLHRKPRPQTPPSLLMRLRSPPFHSFHWVFILFKHFHFARLFLFSYGSFSLCFTQMAVKSLKNVLLFV